MGDPYADDLRERMRQACEFRDWMADVANAELDRLFSLGRMLTPGDYLETFQRLQESRSRAPSR